MSFKKIETPLQDCYIIEPQVFGDSRGFFMESYSKKEFEKIGIYSDFLQDNHSMSKAGVFRGFHFQFQNPQTKLVRVISGSVIDFAIDLRKKSKTFGRVFSILLSAENKKQLFIPQGFAHGFITLENNTEFVYKCDNYYEAEFDSGIHYNSYELSAYLEDFFKGDIIISEKDKNLQTFSNFIKNNPF